MRGYSRAAKDSNTLIEWVTASPFAGSVRLLRRVGEVGGEPKWTLISFAPQDTACVVITNLVVTLNTSRDMFNVC